MLADDLDFVVIGVMKSGTTSMEQNLRSSANSALVPNHYGTRPDLFGDARDAAYLAFAEAMIGKIRREKGPDVRIGHVKGTYHATPSAMDELIAQPHLKLVMTYRDPAGRLYSHYNHELKQGYTRLDFDQWVDSPAGREGIEISSLGHCLESFADRLTPERFRIMPISQTAEPEGLARLCDFLDIDRPTDPPAVGHTTTMPRLRTPNYLARQTIDGIFTRGTRLNAGVNRLRKIALSSGRKPEKMDPGTKAKWARYFAEDFRKFEDLAQPFML